MAGMSQNAIWRVEEDKRKREARDRTDKIEEEERVKAMEAKAIEEAKKAAEEAEAAELAALDKRYKESVIAQEQMTKEARGKQALQEAFDKARRTGAQKDRVAYAKLKREMGLT